jgi:filamentous hemagglutinin family protein
LAAGDRRGNEGSIMRQHQTDGPMTGFTSRLAGSFGRHALSGVMAAAWALPAFAGPEGAAVIQGNVSIDRAGATTNIHASNNSIINYRSFDIAAHETVRFIQPDSSSRVLNRINSSSPTQIDGSLLANGRVYLVNPAGVFFSRTAVINTASIYAAAASMSDGDFTAGIDRFIDAKGSVINEGKINAQTVALIGKNVANKGEINAPAGTVMMLAGDEIFIGQRDGKMFVKIDASAQTAAGPGVDQAGSINAERVSLGAGDMYSLAIRHTGTTRAKDVRIEGQGRGKVEISGGIDASNTHGKGGEVRVLGETINLAGAKVDASGAAGGGKVIVGGNFQGKGPERNAQNVNVDDASLLSASATQSGDAGSVVVWSDGTTRFAGKIDARAFSLIGKGGDAEVSGKQHLWMAGRADLRATSGKAGTLLLDPGAVAIVDGPNTAPPGSLDSFNDGWIENQLTLGNLTITTASSSAGGAENLTMQSAASITWANTNSLELVGRDSVSIDGDIAVPAGATLTLTGDEIDITSNGSITGAGAAILRANDTTNYDTRVAGTEGGGRLDLTTTDLGRVTNTGGLTIGRTDSDSSSAFLVAGNVTFGQNTELIAGGTLTVGVAGGGNETATVSSGSTLTLTADEIDVVSTGAIAGAGNVALRPKDITAFDVSISAADTDLNLSPTELGRVTNTGTLTIGRTDNDATSDVIVDANVTFSQSTTLVSGGTVSVTGASVTAPAITLHGDANDDAAGFVVSFGAASELRADSITLRAGNGAGGGNASSIDPRTNTPEFHNTANAANPTAFTLRQDDVLGALQIPDATQFFSPTPAGVTYTLQTDVLGVDIDATGGPRLAGSTLVINTAGASQISSAITPASLTVTGSGSLTLSANILISGALNLGVETGIASDLELGSTGSTVSLTDGVTLQDGVDLTVTADKVDISDVDNIGIEATPAGAAETLVIRPNAVGVNMRVGGSAGAGLDLTSAELLLLQDGLGSITLGRSNAGTMTIGTGATFRDPVNLVSGTIDVANALSGTDNASITLTATTSTTVGADISTVDSNITFAGPSTFSGTRSVDAGAGTVAFDALATLASADLTVTADEIDLNVSGTTIGGTGTNSLVLRPSGNAVDVVIDDAPAGAPLDITTTEAGRIASTVTSLTIGRSDTAGNLTTDDGGADGGTVFNTSVTLLSGGAMGLNNGLTAPSITAAADSTLDVAGGILTASTGALSLQSDADGAGGGNMTFSATPTLRSTTISLQAGNGSGSAIVDATGVDFQNVAGTGNPTTFTHHSAGAITDARIADGNQFQSGPAGVAYSLISDTAGVTLSTPTKVSGANLTVTGTTTSNISAVLTGGDSLGSFIGNGPLTLSGAMNVTGAAGAVFNGVTTLGADVTSANRLITFNNSVTLSGSPRAVNAGTGTVTFNSTGTGSGAGSDFNITGGNVTISKAFTNLGALVVDASGNVGLNAGLTSNSTIGVAADGTLDVNNSTLTATTSISLQSDADSTGGGNMSFTATPTLRSAAITLRAGNGTGAAIVDATGVNIQNAAGSANPTSFTQRHAGAVGDVRIAAGSQFFAGSPTGVAYSLISDTAGVTLSTATKVAGADLTVTGLTTSTISAVLTAGNSLSSFVGNGPLTLSGAMNVTSAGGATFNGATAVGADVTAQNANITFAGASTFTGTRSVDAGTGTVAFSALATLSTSDLTVTADEIDLNVAGTTITGTGTNTLTLRSSTSALNTVIDATAAGGRLDITTTEAGRIAAGVDAITIGRSDNTGSLTTADPAGTTFNADLTLLSGGAIAFNGDVTAPSITARADSTLDVNASTLTGTTGITLQSDADSAGGGDMAFTATSGLNSPVISLRAGNGTGAAVVNASNVDLRNAAGTANPTTYTHRSAGAITDAQIAAASQFFGGTPSGLAYSLISDTAGVTLATGGKVVGTNLTVTGATNSAISADLDTNALGQFTGNGPITLTGAMRVTSGAAVFNGTLALQADITGVNQAVTFNQAVTVTGSRTVNTGTTTFSNAGSGTIDLNSGALTVLADEVNLGANITGPGTIAFAPATAGNDLRLGGTLNTDPALNLINADLARLQSSVTSAVFGSSTMTGTVDFATGATFALPSTFRVSSTGSIDVSTAVSGTGTATLTFDGPTNLSANVTTANQQIDFVNGTVTVTSAPVVNAGTALISISSDVDLGAAGALSLIANEINLSGTVSAGAGTGSIALRPSTASNGILIGAPDDLSGALDISATDLAALDTSIPSIIFGDPTLYSGTITFGGPSTFHSATRFATTGTIDVNADITGSDNATLRFSGPVDLGANVVTLGNAVQFDSTVQVAGGARTIDTTNSGGSAGANITITGATDSTTAEDLTLRAGSGNILTGAVGATDALGTLTITSAADVTMDGVEADGLVQSGGTGTSDFGAVTAGAAGINLTGAIFTFADGVTTTGNGTTQITHSGLLSINTVAWSLTGAMTETATGGGSTTIGAGGAISQTDAGLTDSITFNGPVGVGAAITSINGNITFGGTTTVNSAVQSTSGNIDFNAGTTLNANVTTGGAAAVISFDGITTVTGDRTANAGLGTVSNSARINVGNADALTFTADEISLAGELRVDGDITFQPFTASLAIQFGGTDPGDPSLSLTDAELGNFVVEVPNRITVGHATGTGALTVATVPTWGNPFTFRSGTGPITVTQTFNAASAIFDGPTTVNANVNALGGSLAFNDTAVINSNISASTTVSFAQTLTLNANVSGVGVTLSGAATVTGDRTINASTGTLTLDAASSIAVGANALTLIADEMTFTAGSAITGDGTNSILALLPATNTGAYTINTGTAAGSGTTSLDLTQAELDVLGSGGTGFQRIDIGRFTAGANPLNIGTTFANPTRFLATGGGGITVTSGSTLLGANAASSLTFTGDGAGAGVITLAGDVLTAGAPITFNDTVHVVGVRTIDSTNNGAAAAGADITLNSLLRAVTNGAGGVAFNSGTDNATIAGALGIFGGRLSEITFDGGQLTPTYQAGAVLSDNILASDVTFNGPVETTAAVEIDGGTGTVQVNSRFEAGANDLAFTSDEVNFAGGASSIRGTGILTIQPSSAAQNMRLGGADAAGFLHLSDADISAIQPTWQLAQLGRIDGTGNVEFADSVLTPFPVAFIIRGGGTIFIVTDIITGNLPLTFNQPVAFLETAEINTGTALLDFRNTLDLQAAGITATLTGDAIDFGGDVSNSGGGGTLVLRPATLTFGIRIGAADGDTPANFLNILDSEVNRIQNGFSLISFGRSDMTGQVIVVGTGVRDFINSTELLTGGTVTLDRAVTMTDADDDISLKGAIANDINFALTTNNGTVEIVGATNTVDAAIATAGGDVTITGSAANTTTAQIGTAGGDVTISGPTNTIGAAITSGAGSVSLNATIANNVNAAITSTGGAVGLTATGGSSANTTTAQISTGGGAVAFNAVTNTIGGAISSGAGNVSLTGTTNNLNANITSAGGDFSSTGATVVGANVTLATGGGDIVFNNVLRADTAGTRTLTLNAGAGTVEFRGDVTAPEFTLLDASGGAIDLFAANYQAVAFSFNNAVQLNTDVTITATAASGVDGVVFEDTVNNRTGTRSLTVNTPNSALTRFRNNVGNAGALGTIETDALGATILGDSNSVSVSLSAATVRFLDSLRLATDATVGATTQAAFAAIDADSSAGQDPNLIVNSPITTFNGRIGVGDAGGDVLGDLTTDAGGSETRINTDRITLAGNAAFNDAVNLDNNLRVDANSVGFGSTVNSLTERRDLTINATTTTFNGRIGNTLGLAQLQVTRLVSGTPGTITVNAPAIDSNRVVFNEAMSVAQDVVFTASSDARFAAITASNAGVDFTVNSPDTTFAGTVGDTGQTFDSITTDLAGTTRLNTTSVRSNRVAFNDAVLLGADVTIAVLGTGNAALPAGTFSTIDAPSANSLTINSPGFVMFGGNVGVTNRLDVLTTDSTGTTILNAAEFRAADFKFGDAVLLAADAIVDGTTNIEFLSTVDSAAGGARSLNARSTGGTTFAGRVGAGSRLATLSTDQVGTVGGATSFSTDQVFADAMLFRDRVLVGGAGVTFDATNTATFGAGMDSQTAGATGVIFDAASTEFAGSFGGQAALASLTVNSPLVLTAAADITTTGAVAFNGTINSQAAESNSLFITAPGGVTFASSVGQTTALGRLRTSGAGGTTTFRGTDLDAVNFVEFLQPFLFTQDLRIDSGSMTFGSTVDSSAGQHALSLNAAGSGEIRLNGDVGAQTLISSLSTGPAGTTFIAGSTLNTSGDQTYGNRLQVSGTSLIAGGGITVNGFGQFVDGTLTSNGFPGITLGVGGTYRRDITANNGGSINIGGATTLGGNVTTNGSGGININGTTTIERDVVAEGSGDININGTSTLASNRIESIGGLVNIAGATTLTNNVLVAGRDVVFGDAGSVTSTSDGRSLTLRADTGGQVTLAGTLGSTDARLGALTIEARGPARSIDGTDFQPNIREARVGANVFSSGRVTIGAPTVLTADTVIDANHGAFFRSNIREGFSTSSDPSVTSDGTPRDLTIRYADAPTLSDSGPGGYYVPVIFNGSVTNLRNLNLGGDLDSIPQLASFVMTNSARLDGSILTVGTSLVPSTPFQIIATGDFRMGRGQSLTVLGPLTLTTPHAVLGDMTVVGDLVVDSPAIELNYRGSGSYLFPRAPGASYEARGTDRLGIVAEAIDFSSTPIQAPGSAGVLPTFSAKNGDVSATLRTFGFTELKENIFATVFQDNRGPGINTSFFLGVSYPAGTTPFNIASAIASAVPRETRAVRTQTRFELAAEDIKVLEEMGIYLKSADEEFAGYLQSLSEHRVYNDIPQKAAPSHGSRNSDYRVSPPRLNAAKVTGELVPAYNAVMAPPEAGQPALIDRHLITDAAIAYSKQVQTFTPEGFRAWVDSTPEQAAAKDLLDKLRRLFELTEQINLSPFEARLAQRAIITNSILLRETPTDPAELSPLEPLDLGPEAEEQRIQMWLAIINGEPMPANQDGALPAAQ